MEENYRGFQEYCPVVKDLIDGEKGQYYYKIKQCDGDKKK